MWIFYYPILLRILSNRHGDCTLCPWDLFIFSELRQGCTPSVLLPINVAILPRIYFGQMNVLFAHEWKSMRGKTHAAATDFSLGVQKGRDRYVYKAARRLAMPDVSWPRKGKRKHGRRVLQQPIVDIFFYSSSRSVLAKDGRRRARPGKRRKFSVPLNKDVVSKPPLFFRERSFREKRQTTMLGRCSVFNKPACK